MLESGREVVEGAVNVAGAEVLENAGESLGELGRTQRRRGTEQIGQEITKFGEENPGVRDAARNAAFEFFGVNQLIFAGLAFGAWWFLIRKR